MKMQLLQQTCAKDLLKPWLSKVSVTPCEASTAEEPSINQICSEAVLCTAHSPNSPTLPTHLVHSAEASGRQTGAPQRYWAGA